MEGGARHEAGARAADWARSASGQKSNRGEAVRASIEMRSMLPMSEPRDGKKENPGENGLDVDRQLGADESGDG